MDNIFELTRPLYLVCVWGGGAQGLLCSLQLRVASCGKNSKNEAMNSKNNITCIKRPLIIGTSWMNSKKDETYDTYVCISFEPFDIIWHDSKTIEIRLFLIISECV